MLKNLALVLIFSSLASCATTEKYEALLNTWVGSSERALIGAWGPPTSVYETGGSKYLTYEKSAQGYVPGVAPSYQSYAIGNTIYTQPVGGSPGYAYSRSCKTTFELVNNRVATWRWEGNACKAK